MQQRSRNTVPIKEHNRLKRMDLKQKDKIKFVLDACPKSVMLLFAHIIFGNMLNSGLPVFVKEQDQQKHVTQDEATSFSHCKSPRDSRNAVKRQKHLYHRLNLHTYKCMRTCTLTMESGQLQNMHWKLEIGIYEYNTDTRYRVNTCPGIYQVVVGMSSCPGHARVQ